MLKTLIATVALLAVAWSSSALAQACSPACDIDGDGVSKTTASDYVVFLSSYGKSSKTPGFVAAADLDGDGTVTPDDWGMLNQFCPLR